VLESSSEQSGTGLLYFQKISKGLNSKCFNYLFGKIAYNVSVYGKFAELFGLRQIWERKIFIFAFFCVKFSEPHIPCYTLFCQTNNYLIIRALLKLNFDFLTRYANILFQPKVGWTNQLKEECYEGAPKTAALAMHHMVPEMPDGVHRPRYGSPRQVVWRRTLGELPRRAETMCGVPELQRVCPPWNVARSRRDNHGTRSQRLDLNKP